MLHRLPASSVPVSLATPAAMDRACRFSGSRMSSLPMTRSFSPVAVVGEGLDHVGARVHELAVQLLDDLGVVQDDLGDERPRLEVPAPLALEEVALGADHGAALKHCRQIRHGSSSLLAV